MLLTNLFTMVALASTTFAAPMKEKRDYSRKMKWFGINESGPEFTETKLPGVPGVDYKWFDLSKIDTLLGQGMNMVRVNFLMERLTPGSLTAKFDAAYLGNLTETINHITSKGAYAIIQAHNYGRFNGQIINDTAGFKTWWTNVATKFANNSLVVFDTNNEYHDMDQQLVFNLNQTAIYGIRSTNATSQYITVEGNAYTGAFSWITSGNATSMVNLVDPVNKLIYQMHQYLDSDSSGTHPGCVSPTIFKDRLQDATKWLRDNKKVGLIGEYGAGNNAQCIEALKDGLSFLQKNSDVWYGAVWWAAGPMWVDYMYSMEPGSGVAYGSILPIIKSYFL